MGDDDSYKYRVCRGNNGALIWNALDARGWEEADEDDEVNFIWKQTSNRIKWDDLNTDPSVKTVVNHLERNRELTTKAGLFRNLRRFCEKHRRNVFNYVPITIVVGGGTRSDEFYRFCHIYKQHAKPDQVASLNQFLASRKQTDEQKAAIFPSFPHNSPTKNGPRSATPAKQLYSHMLPSPCSKAQSSLTIAKIESEKTHAPNAGGLSKKQVADVGKVGSNDCDHEYEANDDGAAGSDGDSDHGTHEGDDEANSPVHRSVEADEEIIDEMNLLPVPRATVGNSGLSSPSESNRDSGDFINEEVVYVDPSVGSPRDLLYLRGGKASSRSTSSSLSERFQDLADDQTMGEVVVATCGVSSVDQSYTELTLHDLKGVDDGRRGAADESFMSPGTLPREASFDKIHLNGATPPNPTAPSFRSKFAPRLDLKRISNEIAADLEADKKMYYSMSPGPEEQPDGNAAKPMRRMQTVQVMRAHRSKLRNSVPLPANSVTNQELQLAKKAAAMGPEEATWPMAVLPSKGSGIGVLNCSGTQLNIKGAGTQKGSHTSRKPRTPQATSAGRPQSRPGLALSTAESKKSPGKRSKTEEAYVVSRHQQRLPNGVVAHPLGGSSAAPAMSVHVMVKESPESITKLALEATSKAMLLPNTNLPKKKEKEASPREPRERDEGELTRRIRLRLKNLDLCIEQERRERREKRAADRMAQYKMQAGQGIDIHVKDRRAERDKDREKEKEAREREREEYLRNREKEAQQQQEKSPERTVEKVNRVRAPGGSFDQAPRMPTQSTNGPGPAPILVKESHHSHEKGTWKHPPKFVDSHGNVHPLFYADLKIDKRDAEGNIWMMKPAAGSNRGRGIIVFDDINVIIPILEKKRQEWVIQKYIERPLLIHDRKFDIRCYALVTDKGEGYFYREGYLRTSCEKYDENCLDNKLVHLTNNAVQKKAENYGMYEEGNQLSYSDFQDYLDKHHPDSNINVQKDIVTVIREHVRDSLIATVKLLNAKRRKHCFELLGYDFMIDADFNVWMIEVNMNPCLEESSSLLKRMLPEMIDDMLKITLDPVFSGRKIRKKSENGFELLDLSNPSPPEITANRNKGAPL